MGDTTRLERWVTLQQKTWDIDEGSKASRIAVERPEGELVQSFNTDLPELGRVLQDCLDMQAGELPAGTSHRFRIVAYDPASKQLAELPQTVRGMSKDASSANQHQLTQSRAHHQDIDTMSFVLDKTTAQLEQTCTRLGELFDDCTQLSDSNASMRLNNEELMLRRLEFERRMARHDKIFEALGELMVPVGTIILEKLGPKLLGATPGEMISKVSGALGKLNEQKAATPEAPSNVEQSADSKPSDALGPVVPEPRPRALPANRPKGRGGPGRNTKGGASGNVRPIPRERGPKAPHTKTKKRK